MMKYLLFLLFLSFQLNLFSQQQYQHWVWAKSFGGTGNDSTVDIKIKNGFLYVTGTFTSPQINWEGYTLINHGNKDIFIAKLDTNGNTVWVKSFGNTGNENVSQLEINDDGIIVLLCQSTSQVIELNDGGGIIDPQIFFITITAEGYITNGVSLPRGPEYSDIEIDHTGAIYLGASYSQPFIFNNNYIDTSFGLAGAALLKYNNNGEPGWYKNIQVRSNKREYMFMNNSGYSNYAVYPPVYWTYSKPITGNARASMQVEFDRTDSSILAICNHGYYGYFEGKYYEHYLNASRDMHIKTSTAGVTYPTGNYSNSADFGLEFASTFSCYAKSFEVSRLGYIYQAGIISNLGEMGIPTLAAYKKDSINKWRMWYWRDLYNGGQPQIINTVAHINADETGNYLIGAAPAYVYSSGEEKYVNLKIIDTGLNKIRQTHIDEILRFPNLHNCMTDLSGIFLSSTFSNSELKLNERLPDNKKTIGNNGGNDILIGKFNFNGKALPSTDRLGQSVYKTCKAADTIQLYLQADTTDAATPFTYHWQASSQFSDTTILNPAVYLGTDSFTNQLTITDANGMQVKKDFVFFKGKPSDLRLIVDNNNVCSSDSITARLTGTNFEPCILYPTDYYWAPLSFSTKGYNFSSINDVVKYTASTDHSVALMSDWNNSTTSPYCINMSDFIPITVHPSYTFTQNINVCPGSDFTFADNFTVTNITRSFSHTISYTTIAGCDSSYIANIIVNPVYNITRNISVCYDGGYTFADGQWYTNIISDTSRVLHLFSMYGCDSTVTYHIRPVISGVATREVKICSGSNYTFPDNTVMNNITSDTMQVSHVGNWCDSTITTTIIVLPRYYAVQKVAVCTGSNYTFPDGFIQNNITAFSGHRSYFVTVNGCDSIIETFISVKASFNQQHDTSVCNGSNYTFPDGSSVNNINSNINQVSHLTTMNGCDSIITTNIHVTSIDTSITRNQLSLSSNSDSSHYQWIDCASGMAIAAANAQTYTATSIGSYAVAVTRQGCVDTSSCYIITTAELLAGERVFVNAFPVPATDHYTLVIQSATAATLNLSLLDFSGRPLKTEKINLHVGKNSIEQNIRSLMPGAYTLVLIRENSSEVITRIIIKI